MLGSISADRAKAMGASDVGMFWTERDKNQGWYYVRLTVEGDCWDPNLPRDGRDWGDPSSLGFTGSSYWVSSPSVSARAWKSVSLSEASA